MSLSPNCGHIKEGRSYFISWFVHLLFLTCLSPLLLLSRQMQGSLKPVSVKGQERRIAAVQKRPVRPILPALYNTGDIWHAFHTGWSLWSGQSGTMSNHMSACLSFQAMWCSRFCRCLLRKVQTISHQQVLCVNWFLPPNNTPVLK